VTPSLSESRPDKKALGVALGGGAVLGAAHIGVLKAFDDHGVKVTHMAGTSMGALVSSLYAFGLSGAGIEAVAEDLRWPDVTRLSPSKLGLLSMKKMEATLRAHLGHARLEEAPIPLTLLASDIATGEQVVMTQGDAATAAVASACVPGVFQPVEREGRLLVDGGIIENLPLSPLLHRGLDRVVGVDVHIGRRFHRPANIFELLANALDIALAHSARQRAGEADILIAPDTSGFSRAEMQHFPPLVEEGYRAALEVMGELTG
jgi:NTE family protein